MASAEYPRSFENSSLCWPKNGAGLRISAGVSESLMGMPICFSRPALRRSWPLLIGLRYWPPCRVVLAF